MITDVGASVDSSRIGDKERKRGERRALDVTVENICRNTDGDAVLVESPAEGDSGDTTVGSMACSSPSSLGLDGGGATSSDISIGSLDWSVETATKAYSRKSRGSSA